VGEYGVSTVRYGELVVVVVVVVIVVVASSSSTATYYPGSGSVVLVAWMAMVQDVGERAARYG
jgi:hypothetical protein